MPGTCLAPSIQALCRDGREKVAEVLDDGVGGAQVVAAEAAMGDPDAADAGLVRPLDVARRVAHGPRLLDRYVAGATGPDAFDCSGLVRFAYRRAEISKRLGGGHSARQMLLWAREHGKTRKHNPKRGDVVIYGNGSHAAIWIGDGKVISALNPTQDIKITRLRALGAEFTAFIRTRP